MSEVSIPKFRSAKRLVQWMDRNWAKVPGYRLPPDRESVFFSTKKDSPKEVAACVAKYAGWAGRLGAELEALLVHDRDSVVDYIPRVVGKGQEVSGFLMDSLAGDSRNLLRAAKYVGRLPDHLERAISEPRYAFLYAKDVLRGRLPRHLEDVFFKDAFWAAKYAFEVIRGFASVRLPEELHTFMVMKSFQDPNNEYIRTYMEASESDPNRVGNTVSRVA